MLFQTQYGIMVIRYNKDNKVNMISSAPKSWNPCSCANNTGFALWLPVLCQNIPSSFCLYFRSTENINHHWSPCPDFFKTSKWIPAQHNSEGTDFSSQASYPKHVMHWCNVDRELAADFDFQRAWFCISNIKAIKNHRQLFHWIQELDLSFLEKDAFTTIPAN